MLYCRDQNIADLKEFLQVDESTILKMADYWQNVEVPKLWALYGKDHLQEFYESFNYNDLCFNMLFHSNVDKPHLEQVTSNEVILDYGCGSAAISFILAKTRHCRVELVDYRSKVYPFLVWRFQKYNIPFTFYLPTDEITQTYDRVLLFDVMEHLPNPDEVLVRITHLLKPGGFLNMWIPEWGGSGISHLVLLDKEPIVNKYLKDNYVEVSPNVYQRNAILI